MQAEDAEAAVQELQKGLDAAGATSQGVTVDIPAGYPQGFPLQNILREWNPDDVRIPAHYPSKYNSLRYFDFQVCVDALHVLGVADGWLAPMHHASALMRLYVPHQCLIWRLSCTPAYEMLL
jgi:hypothetical protein